MQDLLALGSLAALRFGVTVLLVAGIAYLLIRYCKAQMRADILGPPEARSLTPSQWARAITVPPSVPCWEKKQCDPAKRARCPANSRSHVPCWLAIAMVEGEVRTECPGCDLYTLHKRELPLRRVPRSGGAGVADSPVCVPACQGAEGD